MECNCDVCTGNVDFEEETCIYCDYPLEECDCEICDFCDSRVDYECSCEYDEICEDCDNLEAFCECGIEE